MLQSKENESNTPYGTDFYDSQRDGSRRSAEIILSRVFDLIRPTSVIDVGCGEGYWLDVAGKLGVPQICGLDGDYVSRQRLVIPEQCFVATDLSKPFNLDKRFDFAMCMEVAEHLQPSVAESFVLSLTKLAPAILFSAAIPGQGGTDHHNEQWPSYWSNLFCSHDFVCVDFLRPKIWQDTRIEVWYRQNSLLFLSKDHFALSTSLNEFLVPEPADAVHADIFEHQLSLLKQRLHRAENLGIRDAGSQLKGAIKRWIAKKTRK